MNSSVGGCGGGEVDGVRSGYYQLLSLWRILHGLPAAGIACFLGFATARGLTLSSESELGSIIRCRLAGFEPADWRVVAVPPFSQGSVLAMIKNISTG